MLFHIQRFVGMAEQHMSKNVAQIKIRMYELR
jgi:hypothetical protein